MDAAVAYKRANPTVSYAKIAEQFGVSKSTLNYRIIGKHARHGERVHRRLSAIQENTLIDKIDGYASRGTLLTPAHVHELAQAMCAERVGINWTSNFLRRHKDRLSSRFFSIQEAARLKADTPANRQAFHALLQETISDHEYAPMNIYNMDEASFQLSTDRRTRRIGPTGSSSKKQAKLADDVHITVIAAISTTDAIIPPFLIYSGGYLIEEWLSVQDAAPALMAAVTDSGYINNYMALRWLTDCFDPATRARAGSSRRLLILDGHESHVNVAFLKVCWTRNIVCLILPAHLSGRYQPLDVNFFNPLKLQYHHQLDAYQLGSTAARAPKSMFYRWFQRAWAQVASSRQIRSAWARSGLWPLDREVMAARPATPELQTIAQAGSSQPATPHNTAMMQSIDRRVRQGSLSASTAYFKLSKAFASAEKILAEKDLAKRQAAEALDHEARASKKRTRFPQGHLYDQRYQVEHAAELAERKSRETEASKQRKKQARQRAQSEKVSHTEQAHGQ